MQNVVEQKVRLEQKKNRLIAEEIRLKLKERKMRTRHLIGVGGLVTKAGLDYLPTNTLYGALLSIASSLEANQAIKDEWTRLGKAKLDQEQTNKHAVILKFEQEPSSDIRTVIRNHGLKWNKLRQEWYGFIFNVDSLKNDLGSTQYQIEEF
ncbi:Conjugal transfer protein TraD superfamily protein (plasmid) [Candidatus Trichorickettsia mobilis]|uniref:conjugal transfer protein TraD n=1 Tax=Candidatus Trichorickettsia mobilis TaxID=1346319 RepID=UPI002B257372|nr:conjugal transfer protein TraD [Candidatus Trichorickettsia mobilis]WPY01589.1 Conjugal transfer protein TraD superfamily protein [Candidatus Trichorickettsia mobilis]